MCTNKKPTSILLTSLITVALSAGVVFATPPGLLHHWNFDEGPDWHDDEFQAEYQSVIVIDYVGGLEMTLHNMDPSDWVSGRQFKGLDFDGDNDYLTAAAITTLQLT